MTLPEFLTQDTYGRIHLDGHRIGLREIVQLYRDQYTPEMLHDHFPTISLPLIHKVIAFYLENVREVDDYVQACQKAVAELEATVPPGPSATELRQRMERKQRESA